VHVVTAGLDVDAALPASMRRQKRRRRIEVATHFRENVLVLLTEMFV
jgi:hypothetical protein